MYKRQVFGRMEMAGLSISSDVGEGTVTLISYDDNPVSYTHLDVYKRRGYINIRSAGKRFYTWIKRNGLGERTGQVLSLIHIFCQMTNFMMWSFSLT